MTTGVWYLLVLQATTMHSSNIYAGWTNLAQFRSQQACAKASEELTALSNQYNKTGWYEPKNGAARFVCIKDMT